MKRLLMISSFVLVLLATAFDSVTAQPKSRRQQNKKQQPAQVISDRARLMYPTSLEMPEEVVWRRDLYRQINLEDSANVGLYEPVTPVGKQLNLFTYIFKLALNGYLPVYEYRLDGQESFTDSSKVAMKTILDNQHIFYEKRGDKLRVDNSDIPSEEVKLFYLKESAYYDEGNAQFRRKVLALCPVMVRQDEFSSTPEKRPLFWVKFSELEPFLNRQTVMASSLNNAATMTMEDFFSLHCYKGDIYKTGVRQTKSTSQFGDFVDADQQAREARQQAQKIEDELQAFENHVFGHTPQRDSLEKAATATTLPAPQAPAKAKKEKPSRQRSKVSAKKPKTSKSSSSGSARISVRRQRH